MILLKGFLFISVFILSIFATPRLDPIVDANAGLIKGLQTDDGSFSMFLGIPYAIVDKANPFGVSTPHPGFNETFEAYDDTVVCPQRDWTSGQITGSIDCLQLNVYVPSTANSRNLLPVMVFIHGGGFTGGFKSMEMYGPSFLMKQEVIFVALNYRLGPYGFMCLDIPEVPGNQGLKDQRLALKWVKENIAAFGGDVNRITLMGGSAGSMSTNMHVLFNRDNLFNQAIMQSGTSFSPVMYEPVRDLPMKIAANLGLSTTDIYEALTFLTNTDPLLVVSAFNSLGIKQRICIEHNFKDTEGFIVENWLTLDTNPTIKDMPILIGFNEEEKGMTNYWNRSSEFYENLQLVNTFISSSFALEDDELKEMQDIVSNFYYGDAGESAETAQDIIEFESDFIFNHATYRAINRLIDNDVGNIYIYLLTYVGERNRFGLLQSSDENRKSVHGDETLYLFDRGGLPEISADDQLTIDRMTTLWANFAKYGDPTPLEVSELLPVKWQPNTRDSVRHYLNIGRELTTSMRPLNERMSFWDLFYKKNGYLATPYPNID